MCAPGIINSKTETNCAAWCQTLKSVKVLWQTLRRDSGGKELPEVCSLAHLILLHAGVMSVGRRSTVPPVVWEALCLSSDTPIPEADVPSEDTREASLSLPTSPSPLAWQWLRAPELDTSSETLSSVDMFMGPGGGGRSDSWREGGGHTQGEKETVNSILWRSVELFPGLFQLLSSTDTNTLWSLHSGSFYLSSDCFHVNSSQKTHLKELQPEVRADLWNNLLYSQKSWLLYKLCTRKTSETVCASSQEWEKRNVAPGLQTFVWMFYFFFYFPRLENSSQVLQEVLNCSVSQHWLNVTGCL